VQPFAESAPHATDLIDHFEELHSSLLTLFNKLLSSLILVNDSALLLSPQARLN
jgi:hypothetical protein